ncbi:hypothetical protein BSKO_06664 [Bryopsis sp. KO-2023]|nr:hypothetical protein BSKO_06664 [Bryopsis sp. KO-2023]
MASSRWFLCGALCAVLLILLFPEAGAWKWKRKRACSCEGQTSWTCVQDISKCSLGMKVYVAVVLAFYAVILCCFMRRYNMVDGNNSGNRPTFGAVGDANLGDHLISEAAVDEAKSVKYLTPKEVGLQDVANRAYERMSRQSDLTLQEILPSSGRYEGVHTNKYGDYNVRYDLVFHQDGEITGKATDEDDCFEVKGCCVNGELFWCETIPGENYANIEDADEYKEHILSEKPTHVEVCASVSYQEGWRISGTCHNSDYTIDDIDLTLKSGDPNHGPPQILAHAMDCATNVLV